ncbi:hypothetical protein CRI70_22675 [Streptomyces sp. Ru87]|nr:hypothetical protein CRI70_22675 [Streptomyces sp. Ru87]
MPPSGNRWCSGWWWPRRWPSPPTTGCTAESRDPGGARGPGGRRRGVAEPAARRRDGTATGTGTDTATGTGTGTGIGTDTATDTATATATGIGTGAVTAFRP